MRVCLSSTMSAARLLACAALIAASCAWPLAAEETKPQNLPILFDARERLPKPDLSSLVRLRFLTSIDFPRPFLMLPARFVRNLKASVSGTTAASLSGHPVGVVKGTVHEAMLAVFFPAIKPVPFDDKDALLAAVKDGKVDAAFADGLQLSFWVSSPAAERCCALFDGPYLSQQFLGEGMTIMLRQQDADLTAAINHALATLSRDGRLQEIYLRYFPYGLY